MIFHYYLCGKTPQIYSYYHLLSQFLLYFFRPHFYFIELLSTTKLAYLPESSSTITIIIATLNLSPTILCLK